MKKSEEKDKAAGIVRSSVAGGFVAIQGGGGKRLMTPRHNQMSKGGEGIQGGGRATQAAQ